MDERDPHEESLPLLEGDPLLEQAVQLYLELRLYKRPPEGVAGARRKAIRWAEEEAERQGISPEPSWAPWLDRAFLDVEGDVAQAQAMRRHARRTSPPPSQSAPNRS